MVILNSDAGLTVWRADRPHIGKPERYYQITDRRLGFSLGDIEGAGYCLTIEVNGLRLFTKRDLGAMKQSYVMFIPSPPTVIYCEQAAALRSVIRKFKRECEELPKGFKEFASECWKYAAGWR